MNQLENRNFIDALPHEVELHLFTFFSVKDIASAVAVSKVFIVACVAQFAAVD